MGVSGCSAYCVTSTYFPGGENMFHYNIYSLFDVSDVRGWDPKQPAPSLATFGLIYIDNTFYNPICLL